MVVLIKRAAGHKGEDDGQGDLVLRFGLGLALGVESDVAGRVGSGEPGLDDAGFFVGNLKLAKVEGENAGASELAGGLGTGDGADERGTLWNGDGVVRIEDGFGDCGLDCLSPLEVSELSGSSRLAWTIQLPVSALAGAAEEEAPPRSDASAGLQRRALEVRAPRESQRSARSRWSRLCPFDALGMVGNLA